MKHCLLAIILLFSSLLSFGQGSLRELSATPKDEHGRFPFWRCATVEVGEALRKDHPHMQDVEEFESFMRKANRLRKNLRMSPQEEQVYYIPVVVHIIHAGETIGQGSNISYEQVLSQIEVLNEDFRRMDGSRGFNDHPDGADIRIEFVLADIAPDGSPLDEPGVNRVRDTDLGVSGTLDMYQVEDWVKPATIWDPYRYLNMWTANLGGGLLGYAQFPIGSGLDGLDLPGLETGADTDGVVMRYNTFGSTDKGNFDMYPGYDKGRTTTHEVGHWLGLRHIWGDGGCGADDYCSDTPESDAPNYGCPTGHVSCGTIDMIENYMDYSGDECMNIFTQNQKERMYTVLEFSPRRKELLESDVIGGGPAQANFEADKTVLFEGQQVNFTDRSRGNILSWNWEFEGGEPAVSTAQNPSVTYLTPGVYQVSLTVADEELSSEDIRPSYITVNQTTTLPAADFNADRTQIFTDQQVQFQDLSDETVYGWYWEFEGGEPATSTEQNPVVSYPASGSFTVRLTVTNARGTHTHTAAEFIKVDIGAMLSVSPSSFSESLFTGETIDRTLSISNPGDVPLTYSLSSSFNNSPAAAQTSKIDFPDYQPEKGKPDTREGHPVTIRSGNDGGENGYSWIDSHSVNGPNFNWIDISSTGTLLSLGDDTYASLPLPFEFPFYEQAKSTIYVGSNGLLGFNSSGMTSFGNTQLPSTTIPNDIIAGYWTDLYPNNNVTYLSTADHFIVQFTNVRRYGSSSDYLTFQFILYPNGDIKLQYLDNNDSYNYATIGIENASGTEGMQIAFNTAFVNNNLAVLISPHTVISLAHESGEVAPGATSEIEVTFNAQNLLGGTYTGAIHIASNDPRHEQLDVPVTLVVEGVPAITLSDNAVEFNPELFAGQTDQQVLTVYNSGTDELILSSLSVSSELFSLSISTDSLQPGQSAEVLLSFHSAETGEFDATLTINSNDPLHSIVEVSLHAVALAPPVFRLSSDSFSASLRINEQSASQPLVISNEGGGPLRMNFFTSDYGFEGKGNGTSSRAVGFYATAPETAKEVSELPALPRPSAEQQRILETYPNFIEGATGMAWVNGELYVVEHYTGSVYKYNVAEQQAVKQFDGPSYPYSMTWDGEYLWIANSYTVYGYDLAGNMVGNFNLPGYDYSALAWDGEAFLTAMAFGGNTLYRINETGEVLNTYSLPSGRYTHQLAVKGNSIWAIDNYNYALYELALSGSGVVITEQHEYLFNTDGYALAIDNQGALWGADWFSLYRMDFWALAIPEWLQADISLDLVQVAGGASFSTDVAFRAIKGMPVGTHTLELGISTNDPAYPQAAVSFTMEILNSAPAVILQVADQSLVLGKDVFTQNLIPLFQDLNEEQVLTYYASADNEKIAVNTDSNQLTVTPRAGGTSTVSVYAEDPMGSQSQTFTFVVTVIDESNTVPQQTGSTEISLMQQHESVELRLGDFFEDADGDQLVYTATVSDGNLLSSAIAEDVLTLTALSGGEVTVNVVADDQRGGTAVLSFSLTLNRRPEVIQAPQTQQMVLDRDTYSLDLTEVFIDADGDHLSFTAESSNEGIVTVGLADGILTLTPQAAGETSITLTAADDKEGAVQISFTLSAHHGPSVQDSRLLSARHMQVGDTVTLNLYTIFTQAEGEVLKYEVSHQDGLVNTRILGTVLEMSAIAIGNGKLQIVVTDVRGAQLSTEMDLTVTEVTALKDDELGNSFVTYPNPFTEKFHIKIDKLKPGKVNVMVYDQHGREVESIQWEETSGKLEKTIDLSSKPAGLYILRVMTTDGNTIRKLIKQ